MNVYISIDKDVLRTDDAVTNWSNGDMTLMELQAVLRIVYAHERVMGVDITGECSNMLDYATEVKDASIDNRTNEIDSDDIVREAEQGGDTCHFGISEGK